MTAWRTRLVTDLCQGMREANDYSAAPFLADALQEAGYPEEDVPNGLRAQTDAYELGRLVALVYSDETAEAVRVVEDLAEKMGSRAFCQEGDGYGQVVPVTYARLMRVGERFTVIEDGWGGNKTVENGDEDLRSWGDYEFTDFWKAYQVLTGTHAEGNPFCCTC